VADAFGHLDELGDGPGFRKIRERLGVTAFGVNAIVFPPGQVGRAHYHERQDELYFVHRGRLRFRVGDEERDVGEGGLVHVDAATPRVVSNPFDEDAVVLVVGADDGYVGRDGVPAAL
jgi:mannose-6-phosphate isomerase-like protein (cupin superfamily)